MRPVEERKTDIETENYIIDRFANPTFYGMFYNNSTPVAIVNQDTTFSQINESFIEATGYSREELTGMNWTHLVSADILDSLLEKNERRVTDPKGFPDDYEITFINKQGEKHYAQMAVTYLPLLKKRIVAFLIITRQKKALEDIEERTAMLQKEVNLKDIEITSYLLKLASNNTLGEQICSRLKKIGEELTAENEHLLQEFNEIIRDMEFYYKSGFWETLDEHFLMTHPQFVKKLTGRHPTITPAEIKLATLLSLQLSTKDIANIMIQEYDSIRVSRTRLRKKLGLASGESLQAYLFNFL